MFWRRLRMSSAAISARHISMVEIMPQKASKEQTTVEAAKIEAYVWSDAEIELLFQVTNE